MPFGSSGMPFRASGMPFRPTGMPLSCIPVVWNSYTHSHSNISFQLCKQCKCFEMAIENGSQFIVVAINNCMHVNKGDI